MVSPRLNIGKYWFHHGETKENTGFTGQAQTAWLMDKDGKMETDFGNYWRTIIHKRDTKPKLARPATQSRIKR